MIAHIVKQLVPNYCLLCKEKTGNALALCSFCLEQLPWLTGPLCPNCAFPTTTTTRCGQCLTKPPSFNHVECPLVYAKPIDNFIFQLKFTNKIIYAHILGNLIAAHIAKHTPHCQAIIPVPLHIKRLQNRGFNQAAEIAKVVAKQLNLPLLKHHLIRHRATKAQATLSAIERKQNLHQAFRLKKPVGYPAVAVIDDVITTGHTVEQCCRILKKSGVEYVEVWCAARSCTTSKQ